MPGRWATAAECLKVVENALPTQTHRGNMLDHKLDMNVCARAATADDTPEAIALENQEPEPVRNAVTIVRFTTASAAKHRGVALQVRS